jgi:FkbM family methyltransferase
LLRKQFVCFNFRGFDLKLRLSKPDFTVLYSIYGQNEFQFIETFLKSNRHKRALTIDGGAFNGLSARYFCELNPQYEVLAIEPSVENFNLLQFNTRHCLNLSYLNCALASMEGEIDLYDRGTGSWGYSIISMADQLPFKALSKTKAIKIVEIIKRYPDHLIILKLDIEGGEHELLSDSKSWIGNIDMILAELHPQIIPDIPKSWYQATSEMKQVYLGGEKVCAVRHL